MNAAQTRMLPPLKTNTAQAWTPPLSLISFLTFTISLHLILRVDIGVLSLSVLFHHKMLMIVIRECRLMFLGFIVHCRIFLFFVFFFSINSLFGLDSSVKQFFHKFLYNTHTRCTMKCLNQPAKLWEALLYLWLSITKEWVYIIFYNWLSCILSLVIFPIQTDAEELNACSYGLCCINNYACRKFDALFFVLYNRIYFQIILQWIALLQCHFQD